MSNETIQTQFDKHISNTAPADLSFIAKEDYEKIKTTPPKRWFNVVVALLVASIGCSIGVIIGKVIEHFIK